MRLAGRNYFLIGLVLLFAALNLVFDARQRPAREIRRLFPELVAGRASEIRLVDGERRLRIARAPTVAVGVPGQVTADGDTADSESNAWIVPSALEYPAHEPAVAGLLDRLRALDDLEIVALRDDAPAEFGLDQHARRVTVLDANGSTVVELLLGQKHSGGGVYASCPGLPTVVLARGVDELSFELGAWLERPLVEIEASAVRLLRVLPEGSQRELELTRPADLERWSAADGRSVDRARVRALLACLSSLAPSDVLSREALDAAGAEQLRTIEWSYETGPPQRLSVARGQGGGCVAKRDGAPWLVSLDAGAYDALLAAVRACLPE